MWSYQSEIKPKHEVVQPPESLLTSADVDPIAIGNSSLAVPLIDIEVVVDERGQISGVCRIELPMTAPEVRVRVPAGFRVYEMLLDGQQIQPPNASCDSPSEEWSVPIRRFLAARTGLCIRWRIRVRNDARDASVSGFTQRCWHAC